MNIRSKTLFNTKTEKEIYQKVENFGQEHVFKFWEELNNEEKQHLLNQLNKIDFNLMKALAEKWIFSHPKPEVFSEIKPIDVIPLREKTHQQEREAYECGDEMLRKGKVALFLVAGGQ